MAGSLQRVNPQVDIGSVTLAGFGFFGQALEALSADDAHPLAVHQMETIGSCFHVNGEHAGRLPDVLQRCSSHRFETLTLIIGWRKGDVASRMSQYAGGQAVALLCFCLNNLYSDADVGGILYDLSWRILSVRSTVASIMQLAIVARILFAKTSCLGFGNLLARNIDRVHDAYEAMGQEMPPNFHDKPTRESMVDFLDSLSRVFLEEDQIFRMSGTQAMGPLVTMAMIMFPQDVLLIVDEVIIHEGKERLIIFELDSSNEHRQPSVIHVERAIPKSVLEISVIHDPDNKLMPVYCAYSWTGHVADALRLSFITFGLKCSDELLETCSDLILHLAAPEKDRNLVHSLGSHWAERAYETCRVVLSIPPPGMITNLSSAFASLLKTFDDIISSKTNAKAEHHACGLEEGWKKFRGSSTQSQATSCSVCALWCKLGLSINQVIRSLLVVADENATVAFSLDERCSLEGGVFDYDDPMLEELVLHDGPRSLHSGILSLTDTVGSENDIARSNGFSTIYPARLTRLWASRNDGIRYRLRDGQIIINGRYYRTLRSLNAPKRPSASLPSRPYAQILPRSDGVHSRLDLSVQESLVHESLRFGNSDCLNLRTKFEFQGRSMHVDFGLCLASAMRIMMATPCTHNPSEGLDPNLNGDVVTTSVAAPNAGTSGKIAIVQTKGNEEAQLLACDVYASKPTLLQKYCCLSCAVKEAKAKGFGKVIVGIIPWSSQVTGSVCTRS